MKVLFFFSFTTDSYAHFSRLPTKVYTTSADVLNGLTHVTESVESSLKRASTHHRWFACENAARLKLRGTCRVIKLSKTKKPHFPLVSAARPKGRRDIER